MQILRGMVAMGNARICGFITKEWWAFFFCALLFNVMLKVTTTKANIITASFWEVISNEDI